MAGARLAQRVYVLSVGAGGLVVLAFAARNAVVPDPLPMVLLLAGGIVLDRFPVKVPQGGAISLTFGLVLTAQLAFGTVPAALINVLANLIGNGLLGRRPWDRALFNAGQFAFTTLLAGSVVSRLGLHPWILDPQTPPPPLWLLLLYIGLYWAVNNALVGLALYLDQPHPPRLFLPPFVRSLEADALSTVLAVVAGTVLIIAFRVYHLPGIAVGLGLFLLANYMLRLHAGLLEANHDLRTLYDVTRRLAGVLALDDAVACIQHAVAELAPCEAFALYLTDEDQRLKISHAHHPAADTLQGRVAGEGAVARAALTRQVITEGTEPTLVTGDFQPRYVLALPLTADDRLVGCLGMARLYQPFSERERRLLSILSSAMAMAIHNGLVYGRTEELARTDPMTGLYNYRYFNAHLREAMRRANATNEPLSLILIDLDNFSDINNDFGHQTGDEVLRQFAALLRTSVRQDDVVARYAGDEFVVVLPGSGREEAEAVAERIREAVRQHRFVDASGQVILRLQASLGVAVYPYDGQTDGDLIAAADRNMYRQKHHHRGERGGP
ncbi:MAG TPA: sensor domain-containing diguanylate cyclase [Thermaerobacter sp.]